MNKSIITIILALAAVCVGASEQPKRNGRVPISEKRDYDKHMREHIGIYVKYG